MLARSSVLLYYCCNHNYLSGQCMTSAVIDDDSVDLTSYITIRHARKSYELADRKTETAGIDRSAYGGRHAATDAAASVASSKNDLLKCSDCKLDKHFELFPLSTLFLHRHAIEVEVKKGQWKLKGRGYQCDACQEKRRKEAKEAALAEQLYAQHATKNSKKKKKTKKNKR